VFKPSRLFLFLGLAGSTLCAQVISSGTIEIPGTYEFDFDAGAVVLTSAADVFWEQFTSTTRALQPITPAGIVNLGTSANFNTLTVAQLQALTYCSSASGCGISGSDVGSLLVVGDVFAVQTNLGNFAKAIVTAPIDPTEDEGLTIQWVTYANPNPPTTPAPPSFLLAFTGLCAAALYLGWRLRTTG
jgi:hypothetical protein